MCGLKAPPARLLTQSRLYRHTGSIFSEFIEAGWFLCCWDVLVLDQTPSKSCFLRDYSFRCQNLTESPLIDELLKDLWPIMIYLFLETRPLPFFSANGVLPGHNSSSLRVYRLHYALHPF